MICRETEDQWELVIPEDLLPELEFQEEEVLQLRPNAFPGGPDQCRDPRIDEPWVRFDDTEALRDEPQPPWILSALAQSADAKAADAAAAIEKPVVQRTC